VGFVALAMTKRVHRDHLVSLTQSFNVASVPSSVRPPRPATEEQQWDTCSLGAVTDVVTPRNN
jgi:hypothetical protein